MTPDRLNEIRALCDAGHVGKVFKAAPELLDEIERLNIELKIQDEANNIMARELIEARQKGFRR